MTEPAGMAPAESLTASLAKKPVVLLTVTVLTRLRHRAGDRRRLRGRQRGPGFAVQARAAVVERLSGAARRSQVAAGCLVEHVRQLLHHEVGRVRTTLIDVVVGRGRIAAARLRRRGPGWQSPRPTPTPRATLRRASARGGAPSASSACVGSPFGWFISVPALHTGQWRMVPERGQDPWRICDLRRRFGTHRRGAR